MIKIIINILSVPFGFKFGILFLEKIQKISLYLMGIGSGQGVFDSGETSIIKRLLKHKNNELVILDVGANKGQFASMVIKLLTNKNFVLHCFEPSKYTFNLLAKNLPNSTNIILNNIGLGKENETLTLHSNTLGSGLASLTKRNLNHIGILNEIEENVNIKSLDTYCKEKQIEHIDLLKIDVEGHELDVLSGAVNLLNNKKIKMISFEFGGCNIDTRTYFKDFFYIFKEQNFILYRICPNGYHYEILKYSENLEQFTTTNYLAILIKE